MEIEKPSRRRRNHTEEFKQAVIAACCEAGASVAGIALANMAWYAYQFGHELTVAQRRSYIDAEQQARTQGLGLWSIPDPQPPWECRKLRKQGQRCR